MTRPGARLNAAVWRMAVSLLALVVAGVIAPAVAWASPQSDADAAITAAWDASGGDGGPLGPRQGEVYAAGAGFAQKFTGGTMFFTPDTGAHFMQGAILDKYESLGGAADGDLGFPTIDEGPGKAPDSRNSTLSAADNPVIFWTPDTGARVVRGAVNAAWDRLGGSAGVLGVPTDDESFDGDVISQKFTGGEISWNRKTKAFTTEPPELADQLGDLSLPDDPATAIATARRAAGGPTGPLGAKDGDQYPIGDGFGQNFAEGKIFYSPETGANAIMGQVLEKYESVGGPEGDLGFPTSSEREGGLGPTSRISTFAAADKPVIFWTADYGAVIVRGPMNAAWDKLGGPGGPLGAPKADQTEDGTVVSQNFNGGSISWDRATGAFTTEPADLAGQLAGLEVPAAEQPAAGTAPGPEGESPKPFSWHWSWWWLIAVVPVVLIAALIVGAALWHRRRGNRDDFDHDHYDEHYDDDDHYGDGPYDDERHYEDDGHYEDGHYDEAHYESRRYDHRAEDEADDLAEPPARDDTSGPYGGYDDATSRFAGPTDAALAGGAASPFDGPTDVAMPVSQWAPQGADGDAEADVASQPLSGEHEDEKFDDDFDDDFEDEDLDDDDFENEDFRDEDFDEGRGFRPALLDDAEVEHVDDDDSDESDLDDEDFADTGALGDAGAGAWGPPGLGALVDPAGRVDDPDDVDTTPTRIVTDADLYSGEAHSGRHAAIELEEVPSATALHLPLDDPNRAPEGYPIKADTQSGRYWAPDSTEYDDAVAEVWFASEEFARTNGFVRAD